MTYPTAGLRQARPLTGRPLRPRSRGIGNPPASHTQQNEDAGTPAVGGDALEVLDRFNIIIEDRAGGSIYARVPIGYSSARMLVCDGDSLTLGFDASSPAASYPTDLQGLLVGGTTRWDLFNGGVSGQRLTDMQSIAATKIDPYLTGAPVPVLIAWGGTNDLFLDSVNAATLETRWSTYFSARNTAGWTIGARRLVAMTIIARGNFTAQNSTDAATFNTWLRANYTTYATDLVDLAADARFQNPNNGTYYNSDTVHLTDLGYNVVAQLADAVLASA